MGIFEGEIPTICGFSLILFGFYKFFTYLCPKKNKKMTKKYIYSLILCFLSLCSSYGEPYCDIRKFSILDGLAANTISDFCQGADNLMWFATLNGLSYYDGYTFHTFRDSPDKPDILTTNRIRAIHPCTNYDLWCITYDRHLYVYDTRSCEFKDIGKEINEKFNIDLKVDRIYTLSPKATWITSYDKKYAIRISSKEFIGNNPELIHVGKHGLPDGNIWFITCDNKGREWVLTDKGTFMYNTKFSTKIPFKWFRQVGNTIYLASEDGKVAVFDEARNHLSMIPMPAGVTRINELKNTGFQLLLATNMGVVVYNPRTFKSEVVNVQNPNQPIAEVKKIYVDGKSQIWVFTDGIGVTIVNPNTLDKKWLFADQADPINRTISDKHFIMEDEHGTLWTIPNGGTFSYYDRKKKELVPYLLRSNSSANALIPKITQFAISDQKILWVTGVHDLTQINFKYHEYKLSQLENSETEVSAVALDHNHNYWDGFYHGYIKISDELHNKIGYLTPTGQIVPTPVRFSERGIHSLYEDVEERMWIGTYGDGIYLWQNGTLKHFTHDASDPYSLPCNNIQDIVCDRQGRVWIATFGCGLVVADNPNGNIRFMSRNNGLSWPKGDSLYNVRRITCTSKGVILVGTTTGLVTFSDEFKDYSKIKFYKSAHITGDSTSLMSSDVNFTLVRTNGTTYTSTLGGCLAKVTSKSLLTDNITSQYVKAINLDEGIVQSMIEDNSGKIWIIRESSIDKYDPHTGKVDVFGPNDFDFNMTFTDCRPLHDPATDYITLGTPMGSITFNPKTLDKTNYQPKVLFTNLHYNGESGVIPILHRKELVIPSNKRNLTISFAALDYTRKYQCYYAYRLEGSTPKGEWIQLGSQNMIGFNHISHGKYVLKVKATNTHGVWGNHIAELPIEIEPTFWESTWGNLLLFVLLVSSIGYTFYSYNNRQKQKMNHDMSIMKNNFFSNASHKLRTPLSLIGGPVTEVLDRETNLSEEARSMLTIVQRNAREMLDMLNQMLKFDNKSNFFVNGDADEVFKSTSSRGEIEDSNAKNYVNDMAVDSAEEFEKGDKDITLLIVEDNADLRTFLEAILKKEYNVLLAENGKRGLELARYYVPDFILTDVTMPVMDGITMIHHIKQDNNIAHIPIIILSAKASVEDQLKGFEEGIDGYLTKPFSATYLKGRIEAVINHRKSMQLEMLKHIQPNATKEDLEQAYKKEDQELVAGNSTISLQDETIRKVSKFVIENISDPDMKIDDIAKAMGMSRSVLYGKIKNAVGMTPIDFVRHIRIMKAIEMLKNTDDTLTNIAFSVGFSDPKYFSKVFKKEMGMIPSDYREKNK